MPYVIDIDTVSSRCIQVLIVNVCAERVKADTGSRLRNIAIASCYC